MMGRQSATAQVGSFGIWKLQNSVTLRCDYAAGLWRDGVMGDSDEVLKFWERVEGQEPRV